MSNLELLTFYLDYAMKSCKEGSLSKTFSGLWRARYVAFLMERDG